VSDKTIFENQQSALSNRQSTELDTEIGRKRGFDRSVTVRSNGTSPFVCNKTTMPGGGLAEERRQRVAKKEIG
jgi:hypothetical protein